ncbi:EF-hand domain-containing protein [Candidatus Electronema halotolerans]
MASDAEKKHLSDFISLSSYDDKYIDREEERRILEEGIKTGVDVEEGIAILRQATQNKGITLERDIEEDTMDMLQTFAEDGKIDKKEFFDAVATYKRKCQNRIPEPEIIRRVKKMVQNQGWKAKEGGLFGSKWFSEIQ